MAKLDPQNIPEGMRAVTKPSVLPIYAVGGVWLIWALIFPLHKPFHFILAAVVSLAAYLILSNTVPGTTTYEPDPAKTALTGDESADSLLREGRACLAEIRTAGDQIKNTAVDERLESMDDTCERIFDHLVQRPSCASSLRKFMTYYLPTLRKLTQTYAELEKQGTAGENITASMRRIEQMLGTMDEAFKKQLDALYADTALDISTDITVMEGMLTQEGLAQQTEKPDEDDGTINLTL